jgi:hypothetical protein
MPAKSREKKARRKFERQEAHRKREPLQPAGLPQGNHLTGFKGMKAEGTCMCGGCHPNAKANAGRPIYA